MCQYLNCTVNSYNHCYIQDMKFLRNIGLANQINGMYKLMMDVQHQDQNIPTFLPSLKTSNTINNSLHDHSINLSSLWHFRLGYLYSHRMPHMSKF